MATERGRWYIQYGASLQVTLLRGLAILIVLTRFVGLERKRLSGHQRLVIFVIGDLFASCYIQRKYSERWQTSKMKLLRKIVNGFTISAKSLIFDV